MLKVSDYDFMQRQMFCKYRFNIYTILVILDKYITEKKY